MKTKNPVSDVVYHRTSLFALGKILEENRFLTTIAFGREGEYKHARNQAYFFSTSRSPDATYGGGEVTLVLDGRKLNQNHKGSAVDYWASPWKRTAAERSKQNELEDRVLTNKPYILNAVKYITAIHITVNKRERKEIQFSRYLQTALALAEGYGIPVSLYTRHKSYRKLDPRYTVSHESLGPVLSGPHKPWSITRGRSVGEPISAYGLEALIDYIRFILYDEPLHLIGGEEYDHWEDQFLRQTYIPHHSTISDTASRIENLFQNARAEVKSRDKVHELITLAKRVKQPDIQSLVEYVHDRIGDKRTPSIKILRNILYNDLDMRYSEVEALFKGWKEQGLTYGQQEALVSKLKNAYTGEPYSDKTQNPVDYVEPTRYWGSVGAGIVAVARSTGRVLMQLRSAYVDQPLTWGVVGGKLDANESNLELVAGREFKEETGYHGELSLAPAYKFVAPGGNFTYQNYIGLVDDEFQPELDWETKRFAWMELEDAIRVDPMHFGLAVLLDDEESFKLLYAATEAA